MGRDRECTLHRAGLRHQGRVERSRTRRCRLDEVCLGAALCYCSCVKRFAIAALVPALAGLVVFAVYLSARDPIAEGFGPTLRDRREVVLIGAPFGLSPGAESGGTRFVAPSPALQEALAGIDPDAFVAALDASTADGFLVAGRAAADTVASDAPYLTRWMAFASLPTLRGVRVGPRAALYERAGDAADVDGRTLARLARHLLAGGTPPAESELPGALLTARSVEVMVVIRHGHRPRLWRSARGNGIGRALFTAARVARERWTERSAALGMSLEEALRTHDVEVSLLEEDGTLVSSAPAFLERALGPQHGVGYERPGHWRYSLPRATHAAESVSAALEELLGQDGRDLALLRDPQLRLYRFVRRPLGTSRAAELLDGRRDVDVIE